MQNNYGSDDVSQLQRKLDGVDRRENDALRKRIEAELKTFDLLYGGTWIEGFRFCMHLMREPQAPLEGETD